MLKKGIPFFLFILSLLSFGCGHMVFPNYVIWEDEGRYSEVEKVLEPEYLNDPELPTRKLYYLCTAYSAQKKYKKLFSCLDRLQKKLDEGDTSTGLFNASSIAFQKRAEAYLDLGQYKEAERFAKKAFKVAVEHNLYDYHKVQALGIQAVALSLDGNSNVAVKVADKLENFYCRFKGGAICEVEKRSNLVKAYMAMENYNNALKYIDIRDVEKQLMKFAQVIVLHPNPVMMNLTVPNAFLKYKCLYEVGRIKEAKAGYDSLLAMEQIQDIGEIYWSILFDRGDIALGEGKEEDAIEFFKNAIGVIEQQRSTINAEASKIGFVGNKQGVYLSLIVTLFNAGRHVEAFEYVERAKARALVDILASRNQFAETTNTKKASDLITKLNIAESEYNIQDESKSFEQVSGQRAVVIKLKEEILNSDPELASLVAVTPPDVGKIQQRLPADETLIEYYGSDDTLFAFLVKRDGIQGVELDGRNLKQAIESFRKLLMESGSDDYKLKGEVLYKKLIQPVEKRVLSKNLTIVPHGVLHYLPFSALSDGEAFVIDRYNIRVLPSASVMKFLKVRDKDHASELIAFGNPDLGDPRYDLPFAQAEARMITKGNPNARMLIRSQATETAAKNIVANLSSFILHATAPSILINHLNPV